MGTTDALQEILRVSNNNAMATLQRLPEEMQLLSDMIGLVRTASHRATLVGA